MSLIVMYFEGSLIFSLLFRYTSKIDVHKMPLSAFPTLSTGLEADFLKYHDMSGFPSPTYRILQAYFCSSLFKFIAEYK